MKKGFSLGEAIAVLAVVGVVAMLTLPILVRKTQDSANISRLQKAYKGLVDAVGSWMVDDRISDITSSSYITTHPDLFIARYIKTYNQSSESTDGLLSGCYRDRNSHQFNINFVNSYSCAKLANGSTLCLTPYNTEEYIVLYGCGNTRNVTGTRKVNKTMLKSEYCAAYPTASICGAMTEDREVCALSQSMFADLVTKVFEYKNEGEEEGDRHTHKKVLQMLKTKGIDKVAEDEEYCNMLENDFGNEFFKQMMDEIVNDTKWGQKMHKDSNVKNLFEKWKESGEEDLIHIMGSEDRPCGHTEFSLNILTKNSVIQYATKVVFTGNGEGSGEGGLDEEKIEKLGQGIIDKILSNIPYEEFIEDKEMCCTAYQTVYGEHLECPIQETVTVA